MQFDGFRPKRTESGLPLEHQRWVMGESKTITLGDALKITSDASTDGGYVEPADATGDNIYGYAIGFEDSDGFSYGVKTSNFDGTYTEAADGDTYVSSATNLTSKKVQVVVVPAAGVICSAKLSAAGGTTAGSNKVGNYLDILTTDSTTLDESSVTASKANYQLVPGISASDPTDPANPDSTTRVMVKAVEVQAYQAQ